MLRSFRFTMSDKDAPIFEFSFYVRPIFSSSRGDPSESTYISSSEPEDFKLFGAVFVGKCYRHSHDSRVIAGYCIGETDFDGVVVVVSWVCQIAEPDNFPVEALVIFHGHQLHRLMATSMFDVRKPTGVSETGKSHLIT